jgi:hypothetical protein
MHLAFQRNGVRGEAIILAAGRDRMRIAERGLRDTTELTLLDGDWFDENGRSIEFESMIAIGGGFVADITDLRPRTLTAGSLF